MVMEESLGLSLSLGGGGVVDPKPHWSQLLVGSLAERPSSLPEQTRPLLGGIDVNRPPTAERELEDETGVSSPNSTVSSVSGKRGNRDESETERAFSDDEDGSRKKLRLSKDQSAVLEESFKEHNTLNPKQKQALAKQLNLRARQVEVWFQNRRARTKLKQTEVDCEFLKRCCENLTDENRRLQKEVQELRALKLSPQFYMQMTPPTTLIMCPSCERVAVSASNAKGNFCDAQDNSKDGRSGVTAQYPQQHDQLFQHRPALPWAPQPLRTAKFPNAPTPRS